ncbi:MAG: IS66 family transposase zinc-finger binding domain-containing protein [Microcoleaceae cyanobacterium]
MVEDPTPCSCPGCGCELGVVGIKKIIKRQVFEIPEPEIIVTEHRVAVKECPECQAQIQGSFPKSVTAPVQYGASIKAVAAELNHQHFLPEDR